MASTDREALVALFHSTGGPGWARRGNWDTDAALATWEGVKVNDQGRVVELTLGSNNLQGVVVRHLLLACPPVWEIDVLDLHRKFVVRFFIFRASAGCICLVQELFPRCWEISAS